MIALRPMLQIRRRTKKDIKVVLDTTSRLKSKIVAASFHNKFFDCSEAAASD